MHGPQYQLVAYALLIEENFGTVVKRGFVNYIPEKLIVQFEITPTMKSHVKRILGHIKNIIKNTLLYTQLVKQEENEEYISKVAQTINEGRMLIEAGFEYVCEIQGAQLFRKRK